MIRIAGNKELYGGSLVNTYTLTTNILAHNAVLNGAVLLRPCLSTLL